MAPEFPLLAVPNEIVIIAMVMKVNQIPVLNTKSPLIPEIPEFEVKISIGPELVAEP